MPEASFFLLCPLSLSLPLDFLSFVLAFFRWQHLSSAFSPLSILSLSLSLSLSSFLCLLFTAFSSFFFCFVLFCSFFYFPLFLDSICSVRTGILLAKTDFRIPMLVSLFLCIPIFFHCVHFKNYLGKKKFNK